MPAALTKARKASLADLLADSSAGPRVGLRIKNFSQANIPSRDTTMITLIVTTTQKPNHRHATI